MKKWSRTEALIAFVFGFLGVVVGGSLMLWAKLPDRTFDMLTFTESAFGIGMTVLTLVFALGILGQRAEIDQRIRDFRGEIVAEIQRRHNDDFMHLSNRMEQMQEQLEHASSTLKIQSDSIKTLFDSMKSKPC